MSQFAYSGNTRVVVAETLDALAMLATKPFAMSPAHRYAAFEVAKQILAESGAVYIFSHEQADRERDPENPPFDTT